MERARRPEAATAGPRGVRCADVIRCADVQPLHDAPEWTEGATRLPGSLQQAIAALSVRARDAGLRVEEAIVELKRAWRESPGGQRFRTPGHRDQRLDAVVTALIDHYFERPGRGGG